ncbi:EthD domain-containing protein [Aspergillus varians]
MTVTALLLITRKPTITPEEFKTHYETVHLPLIQRLAENDWPLSHKRTYIARPAPGDDNSYPAAVLMGSQEDFSYDCITQVTFADEAGLRTFFARRMEPGTKEIIDADEEKFLVGEKVRVVLLGGEEETTK